jgi:hypothetical protein
MSIDSLPGLNKGYYSTGNWVQPMEPINTKNLTFQGAHNGGCIFYG